MRILMVGLSTLLALPVLADSIEAPSRQVHETPTERAVLKIQKATLPAEKWRGAKISTTEGDRQLVRRSEHDSAVDANGKFERTTRTLTLTAKNGTGSWRQVADDPAWRIEHADALTSTKQLGPSFTATCREDAPLRPAREEGRARAARVATSASPPPSIAMACGKRRSPARPERALRASATSTRSTASRSRIRTRRPRRTTTARRSSRTSTRTRGRTPATTRARRTAKLSAAGVSEAHVKDMTASPTAPVAANERGKYARPRGRSRDGALPAPRRRRDPAPARAGLRQEVGRPRHRSTTGAT